jgi:rhamnose transport system ATP-binding protein
MGAGDRASGDEGRYPIGRQPVRSGRRIDARAMEAEAAGIFTRLGVPLDPGRSAG